MRQRSTLIFSLLLASVLVILILLNAPPWLLLLLFILLLLLILLNWLGWPPPPQLYPPEEFFIQDQVIVRGPLQKVEDAVGSLANTIRLRQTEQLSFDDFDPAVLDCLNPCYDWDGDSFVINLYTIEGSEPDVATAIRAINQAAGPGSDVTAEPNWLAGSPWEVGGGSWDAEGSPWEVGGGSASQNRQDAPPGLFLEQWAFKQIELMALKERPMGNGIRVGVFDTSPFSDAVAGNPGKRSIDWVTQPLQMAVDPENPTPAAALEPPPGSIDVSNHGLFSAGMVHALAPRADIQLIRVLRDDNRGDLFTLNEALFNFIRNNTSSQRPQGIIGAVINMSLGIRIAPEEAGFGLPPEARSLHDLLRAAHCLGIVTVAASGNHSANLSQPEAANLPANWSTVIGVAASNVRQHRACFSNKGDIAAPGGDGKRSEQDPAKCVPANASCDGQDCEYAVVGPIIKTEDNTGFVYWSGTSFAAPMVAGLAALVIEKGGGMLSPTEVRRIIECGAMPVEDGHLGDGIINVRRTIEEFGRCLEALDITIDSQTPKQNKYQDTAS